MKLSNFVIVSFAVLFINLTLIGNAAAENPICAGLKGAAFGQCTAAVAVGCDGSINQPKGCVKIEENFTRLSGESAPWVLGFCSCYTVESVVFDITDWIDPAFGRQATWILQSGRTVGTEFVIDLIAPEVKRLRPYLARDFDSVYNGFVGSCGAIDTIPTDLTSHDEVSACMATLATAAELTGIPEAEPTP